VTQEVNQRQQNPNTTGITFTSIRSPVKRFLSGLAQIESMDVEWEGSKETRTCYPMIDPIEKVKSIIDGIDQAGRFFNVSYQPRLNR
jgi:hypothetical protein